eukprot:scaffold13640_cov135-Isochrysis_galbana.AAC.2
MVRRRRAEPVVRRWSATVSEHWSVLAHRITVANWVKVGPRFLKDVRMMPVIRRARAAPRASGSARQGPGHAGGTPPNGPSPAAGRGHAQTPTAGRHPQST